MISKDSKKIQSWTTVFSALIGLAGVLISAYMGFLAIKVQTDIPIQITQTAESRLTAIALYDTLTPTFTSTTNPFTPPKTPIPNEIQTQVVELQTEVANLQQRIDSFSLSTPNSNSVPNTSALRSEIQTLDQRLSAMEQTVLDDPGKALSIPLLQRDLDALKQNYQNDIDNTRLEVSRIYDFNKWFIGLMFTMALGIISLAVSNFIKKPEKEKTESNKQQKKPAEMRKKIKSDSTIEK